jgi:hypothetical protein
MISVADNQFNDADDVMSAIEFCWKKNKNLGQKYAAILEYLRSLVKTHLIMERYLRYGKLWGYPNPKIKFYIK